MKIKRLTSIALIAAVAASLTGCSLQRDVESLQPYAPSDGVNLTLENLKARNVLIIQGEGGKAVLIGSFINSTNGEINANIQTTDSNGEARVASFNVAAGQKFDIGYNGVEGLALDLTATPGSMHAVYLSDGSDPIQMLVPVMDGTLAEYASIFESLN